MRYSIIRSTHINNKEYCQRYRQKCLEDNSKLFCIRNNFRTAKYRAKQLSIPFNITLDYILRIPSDICPVFNVPLEWGTGSDNSGSLDRFIPNLGYIEGNVTWISKRANTLKRDASIEEVRKLYEWLQQIHQAFSLQ